MRQIVSKTMTMPEIRKAGIEALLDRLGPDGTLRFLQQYDPGHGDYTTERHEWLDALTLNEIETSIRRRRETQKHSPARRKGKKKRP